MALYSWGKFASILKELNPNLRFTKSSSGYSCMVYLYMPRHPDADHRGLIETFAIPSPYRYPSGIPLDDFEGLDGKWARGANSFFALLAKHRIAFKAVANQRKVRKYLKLANYKALRKRLVEANYSEGFKYYQKTKHLYKPFKETPNGGQREGTTLYSLPA